MSRLVLLLIAAWTPVAAACSGDDCGPGDAAGDGVTLEVSGTSLTYGAFSSSPNNDCPAAGHPTSLTLTGEQVSPAPSSSAFLTFCLPRPDELGGDPVSLDDGDRVQVIDVGGELDGCRLARDPSSPLSGTIAFLGLCADGTSAAGYAIELDATVPGLKLCALDGGQSQEPVTMTLTGAAAVSAR